MISVLGTLMFMKKILGSRVGCVSTVSLIRMPILTISTLFKGGLALLGTSQGFRCLLILFYSGQSCICFYSEEVWSHQLSGMFPGGDWWSRALYRTTEQ